jgi:hypothetical protein
MSRHAEPPARRSRTGRAALVVGAVALLALAGCGNRQSPQSVGGANTPKAQDARKRAEALAADAVKGAATAEVVAHPELEKSGGLFGKLAKFNPWAKTSATAPSKAAPPPPVVPPTPKPIAPPPPVVVRRAEPPIRTAARESSPAVVRERVTSGIPYRTEPEAEDDVVRQAQDRVEQKLRELDPPVQYRPSLAVVKNEYLRRDSRLVRQPLPHEKDLLLATGYDPDRVYVEYTVEVTADQVRELRTRDRLVSALRVFGVVTAVALAGFLFLRLDEWSRGYLTSWLAFIAVALGGGVVAALVLV